jgi:predicted metal-dependent hydrolase
MDKKTSKTIDIAEVGKVILDKSARARRLSITVRPFGIARVAVPRAVSFQSAAQFAESKKAWLRTQYNRMESKEQTALRLLEQAPLETTKARKRIVHRLEHLSATTGFVYSSVKIRNQKTRWGSCSYQNSLNLNIKLALLPRALMDYVIMHELVHTRIKNHGKRFWALLCSHIYNARELDHNLNLYSGLLAIDAG